MLARIVALIAVLLAVAAPATARGDLELIDLTPAFTQAWEKTAALPDAVRPAAFRAAFEPALPGFYSAERLGVASDRYDARLLERLKQYPEQRAGIEAVSARFGAMFEAALATFEARFGPMRGYPPIYLVNSLGEFDGGTRELQGRVVLMFGADVISQIHMDHDVQPFFHHELFHLMHHRTFPECEAVWCGLWVEGLATYAAKTLNPRASDTELLLNVPEPLRAAVEANRTEAVCAVASRLSSTERADYMALFSFQRLGERLPPRFGYYVGYRVAEELGRTHSLEALTRMPPAEVRPLIEHTLRGMADCG